MLDHSSAVQRQEHEIHTAQFSVEALLRRGRTSAVFRMMKLFRRSAPSRWSASVATISGHLRADKNLDREAARYLDSIIASAYKALTATKKRP